MRVTKDTPSTKVDYAKYLDEHATTAMPLYFRWLAGSSRPRANSTPRKYGAWLLHRHRAEFDKLFAKAGGKWKEAA